MEDSLRQRVLEFMETKVRTSRWVADTSGISDNKLRRWISGEKKLNPKDRMALDIYLKEWGF